MKDGQQKINKTNCLNLLYKSKTNNHRIQGTRIKEDTEEIGIIEDKIGKGN